jgi:SAM-dependent methyltransferase
MVCTDRLVSHRDFAIEECEDCRILYTQNAPPEDVIGSYYQSPEYISHTGGGKSLSDTLYGIARSIMMSSKLRTVKKLTGKRTGTILDIGAGTGHFVKKVLSKGWDAVGVEVSADARKYASELNGVTLSESISEVLPADRKFDAVTMWHVLEHIHEPGKMLSTLAGRMKPGAILVIAVPNRMSADAQYYRENWAAYDVPRHLWHFDSGSLRTLVEKCGFTTLATRRMPFDSFYISILSEKNRNGRYPLFWGMIKGKLFWLYSLIIKEKSSSLLFAFRKKG